MPENNAPPSQGSGTALSHTPGLIVRTLKTILKLPFKKAEKKRARARTTAAGAEILRNFIAAQPPFAAKEQTAPTYGCLIFSKDRPLQLAGLLESLRELVTPLSDIRVLYAPSGAEYAAAYAELAASPAGAGVRFIREEMGGFRRQLLYNLDDMKTDRVFFLVDDIVFIRPVDLRTFDTSDLRKAIPSLRLGRNTTFCYTADKEQSVPHFHTNGDLLYWRWQEGKFDWNYPLSADGHLFDRQLIRALCDLINFRSPNSFEDQLDKHFKKLFLAFSGVCYPESRLVNIPCNRVQDEILNRCGELSPEELLRLWQSGARIDITALRGHPTTGAHQDLPLPLRNSNA